MDDYEFLPTLSYRLMYTPRAYYDLSFLENNINNTDEQKKVIADEELIKLKHIIFKKEAEITSNIECPIMFYEFSENEEIIKLPCQHNFNKEAILKWLKEEAHTCPICRYEFKYKEVNESINIENTNIENDNSDIETIENDNSDSDTIENTNNIFNIFDTLNTVYNLFNNNNLINPDELLMQETLLNSYNNSHTS